MMIPKSILMERKKYINQIILCNIEINDFFIEFYKKVVLCWIEK